VKPVGGLPDVAPGSCAGSSFGANAGGGLDVGFGLCQDLGIVKSRNLSLCVVDGAILCAGYCKGRGYGLCDRNRGGGSWEVGPGI